MIGRVLMCVCVALAASGCVDSGLDPRVDHPEAINQRLGDISWIEAHDRLPTTTDSEEERIATHLAYVERRLRARPTDHMTPALRAARARNLTRLRAYWQAGRFPRNDDHADPRRPTFVDARGEVCAVGHLFEQDVGLGAADMVARDHKYDHLPALDHPDLLAWAATSGLSAEELAMIQPSYGYRKGLSYHRAKEGRAERMARLKTLDPPIKACLSDHPSPKKAVGVVFVHVYWISSGHVGAIKHTPTGHKPLDGCIEGAIAELRSGLKLTRLRKASQSTRYLIYPPAPAS